MEKEKLIIVINSIVKQREKLGKDYKYFNIDKCADFIISRDTDIPIDELELYFDSWERKTKMFYKNEVN